MKTLKVSLETQNELRTPLVWSRPRSRLYDYHNEIGGLYYQPMIKYILSRETGGPREIVPMPDRLQSNFDRIVYKRRQTNEDLQEFLTTYYARRLKDVNSKTVHVKNELMRWSKSPTSLNMIRSSSNVRDKYLCQLQLAYTEQQAVNARKRGSQEEEEDSWDDVLTFAEVKADDRYEPGYEKISHDIRTQKKIERENLKKHFEEIDTLAKENREIKQKLATENYKKTVTTSTTISHTSGNINETVESTNTSTSEKEDLQEKKGGAEELKSEDGRFVAALKRSDIFSGGNIPKKHFILVPIKCGGPKL